MIGLLIFFILVVMRLLDVLGILRFLERMLEPVLKFLGMSGKATPILVPDMALMGKKISGILWGRLLFSLVVIFLLVRLTEWLSAPKRRKSTDS